MGDLAEKRVHDQRTTRQLVFAATGLGVAVIETAGDSIGRFRLDRKCEARDVAGGGGWVAVATPDDVLARSAAGDDAEWVETGFGPAVAVGFDEGDLLAAGPDGELARVVDVAADPTDWLGVADVDGAVRALDGPLVAASDGVYRFTPDGIFDVGLDDVRDVSAAGAPLAATGDGLFRLGNGWLRELDGPVDVVAGTDRPAWDGPPDDGGSTGRGRSGARGAEEGGAGPADPLARAFAAAGDQLYEYHSGVTPADGPDARSDARSDERAGAGHDGRADEGREAGDGATTTDDPVTSGEEFVLPAVAARAWRERSTPAGPVVAVAHARRTFAVAADGTFMLDRGGEWTTRAMGFPDVVALSTPE